MDILQKEKKLERLEAELERLDDPKAKASIKASIDEIKKEAMRQLSAWDRVLLARHSERPNFKEVIKGVFDDFIEFHGDRLYGDDEAISGGIAMLGEIPLTVIGHQKGHDTSENIRLNFGMAHPEGYRKALRLMRQAEKFNRPIVTFIDTPGAYPGVGAEERGQSEAIAHNLFEMSQFSVPIIAVILGEGGSGGALAIGYANKLLMLENSIYSILSPEGYASILWKDSKLHKKAAEVMKLTSYDLKEFNLADGIIKEPPLGAHRDKQATFNAIRSALEEALNPYESMSAYEIRTERYTKFRNTGFFQRFNYENLKGVY
ncbi:MAG: acetyl-CoA carboxylase carboxyltransferase subunit alpha [Bacillota bacterium]